mgnify:CR=1 FL=1
MQKKKGGHTSTYEFLNKDVRNSHKELVERNSKMTPQELDKDIGKVNKISTSTIQHMRGGSTFEE